MINAEKYRTEIQKIRKDDKNVGICRKTGELFACDPYDTDDIPCKDCLMHDGIRECKNAVVDWLLEEVPKYTLTQFEYLFLKNLNSRHGYISRDADDDLILLDKNDDDIVTGYADSGEEPLFKKQLFTFITQDEDPYLIDDILKHCAVVENDKEE